MENLKDFKSYSINEKIGWKEILLSLVIFIGARKAINTYREYDYFKSVYSKINSKESIPTKEETEKLEKIRIDLIEDIESDDKWDKFGKTGILDSIRNIKFKVMDSDKYINSNSLACYINIEGIKNDRKYLKPFLNAPNENDIIAIRRDVLDRNDVSSIVSHELYHLTLSTYPSNHISLLVPPIRDFCLLTGKSGLSFILLKNLGKAKGLALLKFGSNSSKSPPLFPLLLHNRSFLKEKFLQLDFKISRNSSSFKSRHLIISAIFESGTDIPSIKKSKFFKYLIILLLIYLIVQSLIYQFS